MITLEQYAREIDRLEREIIAAKASKSLTAEALAYECAAEFYTEWDKEKIAAVYRQDAYSCYVKAGAKAEIAHLEHTYPQLRRSILPSSPHGGASYFTDEFVATVSHEFRNPLSGILGMSEALLEGVFGSLNELQLNAIQTIDCSGEYLLALIDNMSDLAQLQSGKLELDLTSVTVTELCHASIDFVKHNASQKQIQLDLNVPSNLSSIYIDFQRIRQVLINLLSHTIDVTPVGGKVELVVTQVGDLIGADAVNEIASIQFTITDTSKEIPAIDPSNCEAHLLSIQNRHLSLGLMLVQPIVALHGGNLSCQSINKGNCFQLSLPHNLDNFDVTIDSANYCPNSTENQSNLIVPTITNRPISSPLILIVEDNPLNVNTIESYFTAKGYRAIVANDGQTAVELTQQYHPDLILMDIQMPGMDGLEAIIKIRQQAQSASIPIIALTALAMDGDRQKCLRAGADDYLTKPVKLKQLHTIMQQLLFSKIDRLDVDIYSDLWN